MPRTEIVTLTNMCMVYDGGRVPVQDMDDMIKVFRDDTLSEFHYYKENGEWKHTLK